MALKIGCLKRQMKILDLVIMSANSEKVYYAVARGRRTGIYDSWNECRAQTEGFQNAKFRKFNSPEQAQEFVDFWKNYSILVQKPVDCKHSEKNIGENITEDIAEDRGEYKEEGRGEDRGEYREEGRGEDRGEDIGEYRGEGKEKKLTDDYVKVSVNDKSMSEFMNAKQEQQSTHQDLSYLVLPPTGGNTTNSDTLDKRNWNQYNAEVLALHHRFDSFEKRFDSILKDIGAITSELSHLRRDVKELSESLQFLIKSPSKEKGNFKQSTLNFGSFPSTLVRTRKSDSDSDEPKRKKKLLRSRLPKSNSSEFLKDPEKDSLDELVDNMEEVNEVYFTVDKDGFVEVYTDGCSLKNGASEAKAGIGIWFGDDHPLNLAEPVLGSQTSINAEIQAARVAIRLAIKYAVSNLKIFTDSEFLYKSATTWIKQWKKSGWTLKGGGPVKNRKELEKLDKCMSEINVRWVKVQGHSNIKGNEKADRLANMGALKFGR